MRAMIIMFAAVMSIGLYALGNMADAAHASERSPLVSKGTAHAIECLEGLTPIEDCR